MLMQFLDTAVVCKSKHRDFKKAKERTWDSASLMGQSSLMGQCKSEGKDSKRHYAKENMGQRESKERDFKEQKRL
jgi:hypothetical protein